MSIYKRIAEIRNLEDKDNIVRELKDILKNIELPLINLIDISLIRAMSSEVGISKVLINDKVTSLIFQDDEKIKSENILYAISRKNKELILSNTNPPRVDFNLKNLPIRDKMDRVINFLLNASGIY
jgi:transcription-repair coupling factor (superfamily II helicase)